MHAYSYTTNTQERRIVLAPRQPTKRTFSLISIALIMAIIDQGEEGFFCGSILTKGNIEPSNDAESNRKKKMFNGNMLSRMVAAGYIEHLDDDFFRVTRSGYRIVKKFYDRFYVDLNDLKKKGIL